MPPSHTDHANAPGWLVPVSTGVLVEHLSIADPRCSNDTCRAFREGFAEKERKTPLLRLLEYGKWTVWFYSFWILIFATIYVSRRLHDRLRRMKIKKRQPSLKDKAVAIIRFWAYRRPSNRLTRKIGLRRVSYGALTLLVISTVFLSVLPWPQRQYLRARFILGSPPLSVRCAMIISALTPLTVALAGKVNIITWITGVGYAKLNVYHRYISYMILCLATVHTIPHIVAPVRDGGWAFLHDLYAKEQRELSGTPLYFTTFGLAFFSLPYFRRHFYEAFKYLHIFLGISYIGLLWWHIWGEYMSPYYIYATITVLLVSNIIRVVHGHHNLRSFSDLNGFPTILTHLSGNTTRVTIKVPKSLKWEPGQHAFLCIPIISAIGNHPFFIANIPSPEKDSSTYEMVFLIRGHKGFTKKLFDYEHGSTGDTIIKAQVLNVNLEKPLVINTGLCRVVELEEEKSMRKGESDEHIEDVNTISTIDTITVLEQEASCPMSPNSSFPPSLVSRTPISPTIKRQPSASSFPPCDELTEAQLHAIAQKPEGIRSMPPTIPQIILPTSFRATPPPTCRTSENTDRRASICSLPPVDETTSATLLSIAQKRAPFQPLRTIIDGPYGTHHRPLHQIYDTVLCIVGGWGITALLPHILSLTQRLRHQQKDEILATRRIHLVWVIRDAACISWIESELGEAIRNIRQRPNPNNATFTVDVFVTGSAKVAESASLSEDELRSISPSDQKASESIFGPLETLPKNAAALPARPKPALRRLNGGIGLFDEEASFGIERGEGSASHPVSLAMHYCRPVIKDLVEGYVGGSRAVVMGCGSPSLSAELANVTASLQRRVWNGEMRELKLEIESFGW